MFKKVLSCKKQQGFGMIEIIVSMLVLGIAVIGFAALQIRALDATGSAMFRTQAMALAQDLGERIRLNPAGSATYRNNWNANAVAIDKCEAADCTPVEMAQYDMKVITELAKSTLPNGQVALLNCIGMNNICVYITWNNTKPNATGAADSCSKNTDFYMPNSDCVKLEIFIP